MHDGLAHSEVLQGRRAVVHPHRCGRGGLLVALGRDGHAGQLAQARHVEVLDRPARQHIDLARFERGSPRRAVGNDVPVHVVDPRQAGHVVRVVLDKLNERAALPFLELEGAGANGRARQRLGQIHFAQQMLRSDGHRADVEQAEERGVGLDHPDLDSLRIERLDARDVLHRDAHARNEGAQELVDGEHHVVRGERLAVVPGHAVLQLEGVDHAVRTHLPFGREAGHRLQLFIET